MNYDGLADVRNSTPSDYKTEERDPDSLQNKRVAPTLLLDSKVDKLDVTVVLLLFHFARDNMTDGGKREEEEEKLE